MVEIFEKVYQIIYQWWSYSLQIGHSNQEEVDRCQVLTLMTEAAEEGIRRSYIQLDQAGNQQADITLSSKATEKSSRHEYVEKQWQQTVFFLYTTVLKSPSIDTYIPEFF